MLLEHANRDALIEIANIGISNAARQLSGLLDDTVDMSVPEARLQDMKTASKALDLLTDEDIAWVHQKMDGKIHGIAVLLFNTDESKTIIRALVGTASDLSGVDLLSFEHDAMTEIGNIILSSCIGAIADMVDTEILLTAPQYIEGNFQDWLHKQWPAKDTANNQNVIIIKTDIRSSNRNVSGILNLIFTFDSVQELLGRLYEILNQDAPS